MTDIEDTLISSTSDGAENALQKSSENIVQTLGRWCSSLILHSEFMMKWRIENLVKISNKFDEICEKQDIPKIKRDHISKKFGLLWLDGASLEENDEIQMLWAKLLAGETATGESPPSVIRILKDMRPDDIRVLKSISKIAVEASNTHFIPLKYLGEELEEYAGNYLREYDLYVNHLVLLDSLGILNINTSNP